MVNWDNQQLTKYFNYEIIKEMEELKILNIYIYIISIKSAGSNSSLLRWQFFKTPEMLKCPLKEVHRLWAHSRSREGIMVEFSKVSRTTHISCFCRYPILYHEFKMVLQLCGVFKIDLIIRNIIAWLSFIFLACRNFLYFNFIRHCILFFFL